MITRILATGALAGAFLLAGAGAASAADYTGGDVSASTVAPGGTFTFTSVATAVDEGTAVDATLTCGTDVTDVTGGSVNASGVITVSVTVPTDVTGTCTLAVAATDGVDSFDDSVTITVAAAPGDGGAGAGLPETGGADLTPALWFGAGAIVLGAAAAGVVAATRRKSGASA